MERKSKEECIKEWAEELRRVADTLEELYARQQYGLIDVLGIGLFMAGIGLSDLAQQAIKEAANRN